MRRRRGYTLVEVLLVMALLVMLAALSYPSLESWGGDIRLTAASDLVRARWSEARARAVEEGRPYRFAVAFGQSKLRIAPDAPDYWAGSAPAGDPSGGVVFEDELPRGVRFVEGDAVLSDDAAATTDLLAGTGGDTSPANWTPVLTFLPDGTCAEDAEVRFQTRGTRPLSLRMRGMTGSATTRTLDAGGGR